MAPVALLVVMVMGAALRLPAFFRPLLSDDEAIYAATADALSRGELLYRDVVDHKPPLIYHVYQAGQAVLGEQQAHGAHLAVLVAVLLTAWFLFRLSAGVSGAHQMEGVVAAGAYLVFSTTWHDYDALAANCELFLLAPQSAAAWLLLRASRPEGSRGRWLTLWLASGVLVGISALFKYQGIVFLAVGAALAGWQLLRGSLKLAAAAGALAVMGIGAALPAAVYLGWTAVQGNAEATIYWFRFNFAYVGAGLTGSEALARGLRRLLMIGGVAAVVYVLGALGAWRAWRRLRAPTRGDADESDGNREVLALVWLAMSVVAVSAGGRFFGHYFHLLLAPLSLLAAPELAAMWRRSTAWRATLTALTVIPALVFFSLATWARPVAERMDHGEPPYSEVAARLAALTTPDDRIFVWGNSPQLYVLAGRPMGTRFSFCNYVTGESPGTPTETGERDADANALADAWQMLLGDLDQRAPALFVDTAAAGWDGYEKYPVSRYPGLTSYLAAHYLPLEEVRGVKIYRRRPPPR